MGRKWIHYNPRIQFALFWLGIIFFFAARWFELRLRISPNITLLITLSLVVQIGLRKRANRAEGSNAQGRGFPVIPLDQQQSDAPKK
jgi:hypothetical protein